MHRAICFESKEGTVATECKVDFMEVFDSITLKVSSPVAMKAKSTVVMKVKSKISRDDSEQLCLNVF